MPQRSGYYTAGESGIKTVTRFPIDGLRTTMAGTIDFIAVDPFTSTRLSERIAEKNCGKTAAPGGNSYD